MKQVPLFVADSIIVSVTETYALHQNDCFIQNYTSLQNFESVSWNHLLNTTITASIVHITTASVIELQK